MFVKKTFSVTCNVFFVFPVHIFTGHVITQ